MCDTPIFIYRAEFFFSLSFFPCSVVFCYIYFLFHCSCVSSFVPVVLFVWLFIVCSPILCRAIFVRFSFYWNKYKDLLYTRCLAIYLCSHCRLFHTFCNVWYLLLLFYFFVFRVLFLFTCDQIASCCIFLDVANSYARFFTNSPNYFPAAVLSSCSLVLLLFLFFFLTIPWFFPTLDCISLVFQFVFSWLFRFNAFHVMWLVMWCDARFVAKSISNKFSAPVCVFFAAGFCFRKANGF